MASEFLEAAAIAAAEAEHRERHGAMRFDLEMALHYLGVARDRAAGEATCGIVVVDEAMAALHTQLAGLIAGATAAMTMAQLAERERVRS